MNFHRCNYISISAFEGCNSLTTISFPMCEFLYSHAFYGCTKLTSAYFLGSEVPTLSNSNTFGFTPIAGVTTYNDGILGSIFVRASLLTAFQTAENWSYFSQRMVGLTDEEIANL